MNLNKSIILSNSDLIKEIDNLTNEIRKEQVKRTQYVYTVPYLKNITDPIDKPLSGIILCKKDGVISGMTPGAELLLGYSKPNTEDKVPNIFDFIPTEHVNSHRKFLVEEKIPHTESMKTLVLINKKNIEISFQFLKTQEIYIINLKERA